MRQCSRLGYYAEYYIIMTKKSELQFQRDLKRFHPIFKGQEEFDIPSRVTSVLVLPLIDEVAMPYTEMAFTPVSDYQREVLRQAKEEQVPIIMIPESEFSDMGEMIVAAKFRDCRGVIATIVEYSPVNTNDGPETPALLRTGYQGVVVSTSWHARDFVSATFVTLPYKYVDNDLRGQELNSLVDTVFNVALKYLVPEVKDRISAELDRKPAGSLERMSFMIQHSPLSVEEKAEILFDMDLTTRQEVLIRYLNVHLEKLALREELNRKTMAQLGAKQKEEFLRAQIRSMQQELNMDLDDNEDDDLRQRAAEKSWNEDIAASFAKELRKLQRYATNSPEYAMQYSYLDTFLNLPWNVCSDSDFNLEDVERILNRDHYSMEKVKERIIEQMAVLKLRKDTKAPILCLVGPPGVGKTSLGKSIAEATGRKYVRVALGGVHDEAEIRGHRRTYLGSMTGRILKALEECGTSDPVMVLDEIDKLGADYKGDPQSALLEVLDPEQNSHFHDNYLDYDYDLSKILFIATANSLETVTGPLLDRMEIIEIGGYIEDEKVEIARRHLVGRNLERHGLEPGDVEFNEDALREIINFYTRESGVRQLEKRIAEIMRKIARAKVSGQAYDKLVTRDKVREMLGKQTNFPDMYESNDLAGVVTGLAWTQAGGEILFIESSVSPGKDSKLTLTGNLGDVMKESAVLALQYIKANASNLDIDPEVFQNKELHIHVPEGAIPKDGPSAGITILTSIASALTKRKVRAKVAMTGELTLRGKVLPVGGIKEKILAAKRAGIQDVMLSEQNRKDIEEIPSQYISDINFHFVTSASEVLGFALTDEVAG